MSSPPVDVRDLTRRFGARVALERATLLVEPGRIVGLVGPNGSGKTTLLKTLAGFLRPTSGSARAFGLDPWRERAEVMRRARFAFAPPALFESLTAREHLRHLGDLGLPRSGRHTPSDLEAALERVGLLERAEDRVGTFSFGMRQRLGLALATLPVPELLVLDEPTDGLDPLAILELRGVLERLRDELGVAVLLSSHLLIEIDRLVDELLVLSEGRTRFSGSPAELRAGSARLRLEVDDPARAVAVLREAGIEVERADDGALLAPETALTLEEASGLLQPAGLRLDSFAVTRPSLEALLLLKLSAPAPESAS